MPKVNVFVAAFLMVVGGALGFQIGTVYKMKELETYVGKLRMTEAALDECRGGYARALDFRQFLTTCKYATKEQKAYMCRELGVPEDCNPCPGDGK